MSWSYGGDPSASTLDEVRFWCQDTVESRQLLSDEEIEYLIDKWLVQSGSVVWVASVACEVIAAKMTSQVNASADGVSVNVGELQQRYVNLAQRLRDQSKAEMDDEVVFGEAAAWDELFDPRLDPLVFGVGFMDNSEVGRSDYGAYSPGEQQPYYVDELKPKPIYGSD